MRQSLLAWVLTRLPVKSVDVRTESEKRLYWKRIDRRRERWQRVMKKQAARMFREEGERVVQAFRDARGPLTGQEQAKRAVEASRARWQTFYKTLYLVVGKDFAVSTWQSLGVLKQRAGWWERKDALEEEWIQTVLGYVNTVGADRVVGISEVTKEKIRAVVAEGIAQGHTMPEMADGIQALYDGFSDYRAERIARTEVVGASNMGSQYAALATGLTLVKEWVSTRDERTRGNDPKDEFDHVRMDGQLRPITENYDVSGEPMGFPGDGSTGASPGNVINCRCVEAYSRPEDAPQPTTGEPSSEQPAPDSAPDSSMSAGVTSMGELGGGVNLTLLAELENGRQGVWKPQDGEATEQMRRYVPVGESYKREALAYEIAALVGMDDLVPETIVRTINGKVGSIQAFVNGADVAMRVSGSLGRHDADIERVAVFDYVIGNSDRHAGNWMVRRDTGKVVLIDHGLAFPTSDRQFIRSAFVKEFRKVTERASDAVLAPYLEHSDEVVGMVREALGSEAAKVVEVRLERLLLMKSWAEVVRATEGGLLG